ncbi:MAG: GH116 family glycosyl hydrolase, partial [Planctomycetota bacterium]
MTTPSHADLVPAHKGIPPQGLAALRERGTQRVYAGADRATLGMPCGGICAGQLYVRGDGTLACWQIDGQTYFSGYGAENYRTFTPPQRIAQGFALAVRDADGRITRATLDDAGYDAIEFIGEYPRALIKYRMRHPSFAGAKTGEPADGSVGSGAEIQAGAGAVPPVLVDLEAFSPFIPLDTRNSAWPATVLRFTLQNPTDRPVVAELGGWLENMAFADVANPVAMTRRNRVQHNAAPERVRDQQPVPWTAVLMDAVDQRPEAPATPVTRVLADFESGTYAGWRVQGDAFGKEPAAGTQPGQQPVSGFGGQRLVNSYPGSDKPTGRMISDFFEIDQRYLVFRIGGGAHEHKTCLNLVVDNRVVRSATGRSKEELEQRVWNVAEFRGQQAQLEIIDDASGAWGHVNVDDIALTNVLPADFREYNEAGLGFGSMALVLLGGGDAAPDWNGQERFVELLGARGKADIRPQVLGWPLVGTLVSTIRLAPGESRDVTFFVTWYFPSLHTGHGRMYANWFKDAADVAAQLAPQLDALREQTIRFCDTYYRRTTLPWWLSTRLMMPVANLATGTAQWWRDGRFWAWEGVGCCEGTCTHVWNYAQADAWLFPELARSARTMQDLGEGFEETTGLVGFRSNRAFAADGQAGTVLKCYREHLTSPDDAFLRKHWSRIKLVLEFLISHDDDEDGIIVNERQHNTYDINFVGANTFVGSLYLAALRAGEEMARQMGDTAATERYHAIYERGRQWTVANLYNGEYFEQKPPPARNSKLETRNSASTVPAAAAATTGPATSTPASDPAGWFGEMARAAREHKFQYWTGCLADQVFGQNWAHQLDLGHIYPPATVRSALAAVYRYDWAPDVGPYNAKWPPERWFARPGEPGLFVCTWPRDGRPAEPVRYRDEVWTGIEYQVAAGLLWEAGGAPSPRSARAPGAPGPRTPADPARGGIAITDEQLVDAALTIVHGVDQRYVGAKHNPWNEVECGDHYARALASWAVLHALAGYTWDGPAGRLTLVPRLQRDDFACFFAAGTGWGTLSQRRTPGTQVNAVELAWG